MDETEYLEKKIELKYQRELSEMNIREKVDREQTTREQTTSTTTNIIIPDDLFNDIIGYNDIKELLLNAIKNNKRMGFLFVGPPASAKTMFLLNMTKLRGSKFVTAYTTTKAGLRDIFLYEKPKYLAIDELDKANNDSMHTLLSVIENGIVQKNIVNQYLEVHVNTIIFASCNDDAKLSHAIKSRFQIFRFTEYTKEDMKKIGYNILIKENMPEPLIPLIIDCSINANIIKDPRDFTKIANMFERPVTADGICKTINNLKKYNQPYKN